MTFSKINVIIFLGFNSKHHAKRSISEEKIILLTHFNIIVTYTWLHACRITSYLGKVDNCIQYLKFKIGNDLLATDCYLWLFGSLEGSIALFKEAVQYYAATFMNSNTKLSNGLTLKKNWINITRLNDAHNLILILLKSALPKHRIAPKQISQHDYSLEFNPNKFNPYSASNCNNMRWRRIELTNI